METSACFLDMNIFIKDGLNTIDNDCCLMRLSVNLLSQNISLVFWYFPFIINNSVRDVQESKLSNKQLAMGSLR